MLENAISALSCVYLGKIKHDEFMIRYGIELYNKAISQLARMLSQNSVNVETLYATIVFQTLEAIYCSYGLRAWISHAEATGKLFQRFHKSLTGSPIEQAIYDHQKLALIYSAATASDFTRNYNRVLHTQLVSPLDEIFELYVGISSLINEVNRVAFSDNKAAQRILAACLAQREKISQWYVQRGHILGQYPSSYSADSLSHTAPSSIDLFGLPYNFVNLDTARLYILYWTTCLLAELLVYKVSASMISPRDGRQRANAEIRELRNTEQCLIAESYADEICRCLQYCLQPETNACGVHIIVASLNHVYKPYALLRRREKFQWCQDAFKAISNRGLALASILSHAGRDVWHFHEGSNGPQSTQIPLQDTIEPPLIPNKDDSVKLLLLQMGKGRRTIE
ncbi:hypothetical protein N7478_011977 [Penicillium angulare]|uniref:uncharacterized protein n=1 Tax=Penicillium angulare TaxID=116970 RepID=UPI002540C9CE|nr:uncharacterized protein N7478_011977 [Penicillium angulare]KAJ5261382.1 hypothetical protein N7478_011977 [Penicillium angulare]